MRPEDIARLITEDIRVNNGLIFESGPRFKTLKDGRGQLSPEEREIVMKARAVWHFGKDGKATPAVWKSVVRGKTYYVCNTHRTYGCATTLQGAIDKYFEYVKDSA